MNPQKFHGFLATPFVTSLPDDDGGELRIWGVDISYPDGDEIDVSHVKYTEIEFGEGLYKEKYLTISVVTSIDIELCWHEDFDDYTITPVSLRSLLSRNVIVGRVNLESVLSFKDLRNRLPKVDIISG